MRGSRRIATALAALAVFALGASFARAATRPAAEQEKIDWLLLQIQKSDAVFIRNGSQYDGEKAASHIKTKLWWAGKRVQTAHDFITGVASHSEESGKPYEIHVKGAMTSIPLGDWLLARLVEHEKAMAPKKKL